MINIIKFKRKDGLKKGYLFGFIPICLDIDRHYFFNILGLIRFNKKYSYKTPALIVLENGVNDIKKNPRLIVSLTSFPERINLVHITISTLLNQTIKTNKLILWLAEEQFPNKKDDLPKSLEDLCKYGLEIKWSKDLKSYKKFVPAIEEYPNDIIVTADDDLYYSSDWLESLYNAYLKNTNNIYVKRANRINIHENEIQLVKKHKRFKKEYEKASYLNITMTGSGCLFPPNSLNTDFIFKKDFLKILPTHDDIYTWAVCVLSGKKIEVIGGYSEDLVCVNDTQQYGLCKINNKSGSGISIPEALNRIKQEFPELMHILEGEINE